MTGIFHRLSPARRAAAARMTRASLWELMSLVVRGAPKPAHDTALDCVLELRRRYGTKDFLRHLLRLAALHRTVVLQKRMLASHGPTVLGGPFAGMAMPRASREGCYLPKLLGCYESALHQEISRAISRSYGTVINIGCGDGYYAIGLARSMPSTRVFAHDSEPAARQACLEMARINGVAKRVNVAGEFVGRDFERFRGEDAYVVCDVEGAERELLDPERFPALSHMDILVEMHQIPSRQTDAILEGRFRGTHHIIRIDPALPSCRFPSGLEEADELDRLLALWEWRIEPNTWAAMTVPVPRGLP